MPQKHTLKDYMPESYYHVFARGVNKQRIFGERTDYEYFLSLIERYLGTEQKISKTGVIYPNYHEAVELIAFCLLSNHIHLLIYQGSEGEAIRRFMSSLQTSYSKYYNQKYKRVGALFESRYKAKRIDSDAYLAHISRYIHMNPRRWLGYRQSSLRHYLHGTWPTWLKPEKALEGFRDVDEYLDFLKDYEQRKLELEDLKHQLADN